MGVKKNTQSTGRTTMKVWNNSPKGIKIITEKEKCRLRMETWSNVSKKKTGCGKKTRPGKKIASSPLSNIAKGDKACTSRRQQSKYVRSLQKKRAGK